jgi:tRNA pseudouridine55 synthase
MVSALKVEGKRLYELARAGEIVEREARLVEIYKLNIVDLAPSDYPEVAFDVVCSTGTYVRTLADDLARAVGGRAHLTVLRRVRNGSIGVTEAAGIETIEEAVKAGTIRDLVATSDAVLSDMPARVVPQPYVKAARNGAAVPVAVLEGGDGEPASGLVRLVADGSLVGVYRIDGSAAKAEVVTA